MRNHTFFLKNACVVFLFNNAHPSRFTDGRSNIPWGLGTSAVRAMTKEFGWDSRCRSWALKGWENSIRAFTHDDALAGNRLTAGYSSWQSTSKLPSCSEWEGVPGTHFNCNLEAAPLISALWQSSKRGIFMQVMAYVGMKHCNFHYSAWGPLIGACSHYRLLLFAPRRVWW